MDPITLFALANTAVAAVKQGCALYKDIKNLRGDVRGVIKDLDEQFHKMYQGKSVPPEAKKQLQEEKARVRSISTKNSNDIYTEIGQHLGTYFDNMAKCVAIFEEEDRRSKNEVYTGGESLGKRALDRVIMLKRLEHMGSELREIMVYQCPPELGALYSDVEAMMKQISKEQKIAITNHMRSEAVKARKRRENLEKTKYMVYMSIAIMIIIAFYIWCIVMVVENRKKEYPEFGQGFIPRKEPQYNQIIIERNKEYWDRRQQEYLSRNQ